MHVIHLVLEAVHKRLGDLGWDLTKDAIKVSLGAVVGWVVKVIRDRWRTRKARAFWRPFLSSDPLLVVGRFGDFDGFERSGLLGVGDAIALAELQHYLANLGVRPRVAYADRLEGDTVKQTLILLGGPDANSVTSRAVKHIDSKLRFGDPSINEIAIRDTAVNPPHCYIPSSPDGDRGSIDYGVILRSPNPFAPDKELLVLAGSFGHGTWAAARYVTTAEFFAACESIGGDGVECLIETDVEFDTPQEIRRVLLRRLKKPAGSR
jgi:hypothetical protein